MLFAYSICRWRDLLIQFRVKIESKECQTAMRIIGTTSSPYTRKVRIVALERGLAVDFVIDMPLAQDTRVPQFNPLGKVPVLVLDDGTALIDSPLIAEHLNALGTGDSLIPEAAEARMRVRQWEAVADGVLDAAVLMRMESLRPGQERSAAWVERQRGKIECGLDWMERRLGARPCCEGDHFSLADIAAGCAMAYLKFRFPEGDWHGRFAALARLSAELEHRSSFAATPLCA
jgi:glutathione S-transferase